jgi:hypothetical protein
MMAKSALALFYAEAGQKKNTIQMDGVLFGTSGDNGFTKNKTMIYRH